MAVSCAALVAAALASGRATDLPNPCDAVPSTVVAKALGLKTPPAATLTTIASSETCYYPGVKLTIAVGSSVVQNPATAATLSSVPGLPHGRYTTYAGSKQSQLFFYTGDAATGVYAVLRNYGTIRRAKLERFAKVLYAAMGGASATGAPSGPTIVSN